MRVAASGLLVFASALTFGVGALAQGRLAATFGPRGEITEIRCGKATYIRDLAVTIVKPGWSGNIADQHSVGAQTVSVEKGKGSVLYTMALAGEGVTFALRERVTSTPTSVRLSYELTPDRDVNAETVMVRGLMPVEVHAGRTRYAIAGATLMRGTCPSSLPDPYIIFSGPADWLAFTVPGAASLLVVPEGLAMQFQDDRKWDNPIFSLMGHATSGKLLAKKPVRFSLAFSTLQPAQLEAKIKEASMTDASAVKMSDNRPLTIRSVMPNRATVPAFSMAEIRADVSATYSNPFDPDEIAVDALITTPDRRTVRVPGFFGVPMKVDQQGASERLRLSGKAGFFVRYTPVAAGVHRIVITARNRGKTVQAKPLTVTATPAASPGFVRVSKLDPHYFAYDNGRQFIAVGENLCWATGPTPLKRYSEWFQSLGKAGANWVRLWLAFNEKGLEWMPAPTPKAGVGTYLGLGRYALDNAYRLDEVVRMGAENGVHVMFCIGTYGEFTEGGFFGEGSWVSNPYNARNGGPCEKPEDFWTNETARKLYKQRLRYLIARWGHSPFVFAWEFWNEVPPTPAQAKWVAEMAAYLKANDPNRHLVSTTYGDASVWRCPDVDFTMTHMYGQAGNTPDFTPQILAHVREHRPYGKPYLLAEFGIDWQRDDGYWDPKGIGTSMHNGAWATLMAGAAGTSMLWYWDGYVHPNNLYRVLTPVRRFADAVDWQKAAFEPIGAVEVRTAPGAPETFKDVTIPCTVVWGITPTNDYTILHDGSVAGSPAIAGAIGSPERSNPRELHTELNWRLDLQRPSRVLLRIGQVCTRAHMVIKVDDTTVVDRELLAGEPGKGPWKASHLLEQYNVWVSDYDEDIAVDVPAGKHTITAQNTGGDWYQVSSITIPGYKSSRYPDVTTVGLAGERTNVLWLHNRESTWRTDYDGRKPTTLTGLTASVPVRTDGSWQIEWWNTWTGEVIRRVRVRSQSGKLELAVPDLERDIAVLAKLEE
jgi:hypothetical protein